MRLASFALTIAALIAVSSSSALAKLPAPSDDAKAKAAETALKTAWADQIGAYQLCRAMDHAADAYRKASKAAGKDAPAVIETPACADPGPFVAPVATPPLESSGAHSPATMAVSPPGSKATAAELQGQPKK